jgi:hypothetical protein
MPESRKRPAPLPEDFSKAFGSSRTSASPAPENSAARPIQPGPLCPQCRGSLAESHTVSSRANRTEAAAVVLIFCTRCGCTLGVLRDTEDY